MNISLVSAIFIIGILQIFFVLKSIQISSLIEKHKTKEFKIFLILLSLSFLDGILFEEGIYFYFPILFGLLCPFCFLLAPFLYFYVLRNTCPKEYMTLYSKKYHFILFILAILSYLPFYTLYNDSDKIYMLTHRLSIDFYTFFLIKITKYIEVVQMLFYLFLMFMRINNHHKVMKEEYSNFEDFSFIWMQRMVFIFFIIVLIFLFDTIFDLQHINEILVVFWVIVFNWQLVLHNKNMPTLHKKTVSQDTNLQDEQLKEIALKLEKTINEKELYLNSSLNLEELSKIIGVNRQKLSQTLNRYMSTNFYDYINEKRVEKAKSLLENKKYNENILMLSLDCGFKSRSVFYNAFKKYTKMTPSQYKKSINR